MISQPSPTTEPSSDSMRSILGTSLLRTLVVLSLIYYAVLVLDLLLHPLAPGVGYSGSVAERIIETLADTGVIVIGAFIMRRVPGNRIGPLLIVYGVGNASYATRVDLGSSLLTSIAHLPVDFLSIGLLNMASVVCFVLVLIFPTGQIYPRRAARWVMLYVLLAMIVITLGVLSQSPGGPIPLGEGADLPINPLFVPALAPYYNLITGTISTVLFFLGLVGGAVSLILRYRAVHIREQRQIKWLIWVCGVVGILVIVLAILPNNAVLAVAGLPLVGVLLYTLLNTFPAIGIGLAILRSQLWDIDIVINRTLVYGSLTALLLLLYVGLIFGLQFLLQGLFKQSNNDVAIVVSTLVIAALFQPLRRRLQAIIDRRFYRRKYDAVKVVAAFSTTLRQEVDLDQLREQLVAVVQETMQPAQISLWLRQPSRTATSSLQAGKPSPEDIRAHEGIAEQTV